jgi:hypothetical protein
MSIAKLVNPTRLYVKKHEVNGLLYFGKTTKDPLKYKGSGKHWVRNYKKHGIESIKTIWVSEEFTDSDLLEEFSLFFSDFFDIVASSKWANLIPENGTWGQPTGSRRLQSTKEKIANYNKNYKDYSYTSTKEFSDALKLGNVGRKRKPQTKETKEKISKSLAGRICSDSHRLNNSLAQLGSKASEETRKKMSEAKSGKTLSEYHKQKIKESWILRKSKGEDK